ncbi:hypothetical protein PMAYCL1PPCAC_10451 [Pristionchus mayeri]|uniref:Copper transport protein n=1 Tax=Pristionchus mayeri TaxID=1317129 RepID=A0AAN4ZJL6_9BILA|nr:hypothetical protein PMAYCL1PPCAC_10451 [Pristionchus mayeri]
MDMDDMDMTMDMGNSTMAPMKMDPMWMWFHTDIDDMVLFHFWQIHDVGTMIYSCAIILLAGVLLEFLKLARHLVDKRFPHRAGSSYAEKFFSVGHLLQTALFGVQMVWSYLCMLVFMTFSVWLGASLIIGIVLGFFLFGAKLPSH